MAKIESKAFFDTSVDPAVRGFLHPPGIPNGDGLVLTHGAGGDCRSPLLVALADAFAEIGLMVLRCDLPFRQQKPKGPPSPRSGERDQAGLRNALEVIRGLAVRRFFLGGQSYGGRQASMLAASEPRLLNGLLLLSYPLHPPGQPDRLRTEHFAKLQTPTLFISGIKDAFASIEELNSAIGLIPAWTRLLPVANAGHSLLTKQNRGELPKFIVEAFAAKFGAERT